MNNYNDETQRLVTNPNDSPNNQSNSKSNCQPIPANRLALDAQIQAAAEYQRRLRQRRRIYYIILITSVTMITFSILCFVAWILHNSTVNGKLVLRENVQFPQNNEPIVLNDKYNPSASRKSTLNARKHPTRTIQNLVKRSEMESDEEERAGVDTPMVGTENGREPTRTRKLSFAPEKVIDYKPQPRFRQI